MRYNIRQKSSKIKSQNKPPRYVRSPSGSKDKKAHKSHIQQYEKHIQSIPSTCLSHIHQLQSVLHLKHARWTSTVVDPEIGITKRIPVKNHTKK